MALLDGKQLRDGSLSLDKMTGTGLVSFTTGATMSFGSGTALRTEDTNITSGTDVVNKNYVDAVASGLDAKIPVKMVSAVGSITLSGGIGSLLIDGITVSAFDRILVAAQAGPNVGTSSNGIYVATSSTWYRADDSDGNPDNEVSHGNFVFVTDGTTYEHSGWVLTITDASNSNQILVGTESQGWVQFSEQTNISAGDGLYYTGQVLNVGVGTGLTVSANDISIANTTVSAGSYGQADAVSTFTVNSQGQLTTAGTTSIAIDSTQVTNFSSASETAIFTDANFVDGVTITFSVTPGASVTAEVQTGSLTASKLNSTNSPISGYVLGYTASGQFYWYDPTLIGDITEVVAGNGLTGGGSSGSITLGVNVGNMLEITNDVVEFGGTLSRTTVINGGGLYDLFFNGIDNLVFTSSVFDVTADGFISLDAGTGSIQILADDQISIISSSNDINISTSNYFYITASASQITSSNLKGLEYVTDYSSTFVTHSLVSKQYVDNAVSVINGDFITGVTAGNGLSGGGTSGAVTLDVNLGVNSGLTFSGDDIIVQVDGTTIQIVNGILQGAAQGVIGVTAGNGLSGGGTTSYLTLDVNLGVNSGLIFSGDDIIIDANIAGSGLTFSAGVIDVNVNTDSLEITTDSIRLKDTITGDRTFQDSVIVGGNLTINGTVSYVYTENVYISDNILTLNATYSTGTPFLNAGIEVLRGASQAATFIWDEGLDLWAAGLSGSTSTIITEAGTGLTKSGNTLSIDSNSFASTLAGNGLTSSGSTINVNTANGLVISGDNVEVADTIAGSGLTFSAGVINVNTANGLVINGDNVEVADTIAGSGLTFSAGVINVNTANGLVINGDNVQVADTIAGSGLTFSAGVINVNTSNGLVINLGNVEVADTIAGNGLTFSSGVIDVNTSNGLSVNSDSVVLGGTLSQDTTISGDSAQYKLTLNSMSGFDVTGFTGYTQFSGFGASTFSVSTNDIILTSANLTTISFASASIIDVSGASYGLVYDADYSTGFINNSLITKKYVDDAVSALGSGTIAGVTAGAGLSGGGNSGSITIDVQITSDKGLTFSTSGDSGTLEVILTENGGLTFSTSGGIIPYVDNTTITINGSGQLSSVVGSSQPVYDRFTASSTSGDGQLITGVTLSVTPNDYSRIQVFVNGQLQRLGNGVTTLDCYFGSSPISLNSLASGDQLYWNGLVSGFDLSATDTIDIVYEA